MKSYCAKILAPSLLVTSLYSSQIEQDINLNISNFSSETKEIVYVPTGFATSGRKLSELTWEADSVKMLGIGYSVNVSDYFKVNLNYKRNFSTSSGMMDDYDWIDSNNPGTWSDWSTHPDTDVDLVEHIDINVEKEIYNDETNSINLVLGYKDENTDFTAYGGTYIYSSSGILRDQTGSFSGKGITYKHNVSMPYAKLEYVYSEREYKLFAGVSYSPKVSVEDYDTHHLRDLQFDSTFEDGKYKGFNVGLEYRYDKSLSFDLEYNKAIYEEIKGNTKRTDLTNGSSVTYDGAGFSQEYELLTFKITKTF